MRIIALLFAFVLTGCNGDRLKTEANPTAVALSAPPVGRAPRRPSARAAPIKRIGDQAARWRRRVRTRDGVDWFLETDLARGPLRSLSFRVRAPTFSARETCPFR